MMNQTNSGFLNSIPPVTKNLIIINLLFWVASLLGSAPSTAESLHRFGGFIRASLPGCYRLQGLSDRFLYVHARYPFVRACVF